MVKPIQRPQRRPLWRSGLDLLFGPFFVEGVVTAVGQQRQFWRWQFAGGPAGAWRSGRTHLSGCPVPGRRHWSLRLAAAVVAVPATAGAALAAAQMASGLVHPPVYWADRMQDMLRPVVYDDSGALLGFLPPDPAGDLDAAYAARPDAVPDICIDLVLRQEDRYQGNRWRHWRGVDVVGLLRGMRGIGGGSTIPMQLTRLLDPDLRGYPAPIRKLLEVGAAGTISSLHGDDPRALAAAYLSVAPFGFAYGDVRGITAAADILFQVPPSRLSAAQCALLVAQLPRPLPLNRHQEPRVLQAWQANLSRAEALLKGHPDSAVRAAVVELSPWRTAVPLRAEIDGASDAARLNLGARTRYFVLGHQTRIRAEVGQMTSATQVASARQEDSR